MRVYVLTNDDRTVLGVYTTLQKARERTTILDESDWLWDIDRWIYAGYQIQEAELTCREKHELSDKAKSLGIPDEDVTKIRY
jgi:hypothetical protein